VTLLLDLANRVQWLTTGRNSCPLCRREGVEKTAERPESDQAERPEAEQAETLSPDVYQGGAE
jgi:uncharacterized Zn finger protein (UPF0148 family)